MFVQKRAIGEDTILIVEGVVKLGQSARFLDQALKRALAEEVGNVLVDLSGIDYIDSTGIGELVGYLVRFQERKRKLILIKPPERVRRLLQAARVLELFPVSETVEEAVAQQPVA